VLRRNAPHPQPTIQVRISHTIPNKFILADSSAYFGRGLSTGVVFYLLGHFIDTNLRDSLKKQTEVETMKARVRSAFDEAFNVWPVTKARDGYTTSKAFLFLNRHDRESNGVLELCFSCQPLINLRSCRLSSSICVLVGIILCSLLWFACSWC